MSGMDLRAISWRGASVEVGLQVLAGRNRGAPRPQRSASTSREDAPPDGTIDEWIDSIVAPFGLESEPVDLAYDEVDSVSAPLVLRLPDDVDARFLVVSAVRGSRVSLLSPDLRTHHVTRDALRRLLCAGLEDPILPEVEAILRAARVPPRRVKRTRTAILRELLGSTPVTRSWVLRPSPGSNLGRQLRLGGLDRRLATLVGAHTAAYGLWILSWWLIGRGVLEGSLDPGWLLAWALLLMTMIPLDLLVSWSEGMFAIGAGALLKQRLLHGALKLDPEEMRHRGAGQLLGRVMESEAVESLALSGGILGGLAVIELALAAGILVSGAGGGAQALHLGVSVVLTLALAWRYYARYRRWTDARLDLTEDLTEQLVGHRTRLAQAGGPLGHESEDRALEGYLRLSVAMDRADAVMTVFVPRGWLLVGLAGLAGSFVRGAASPAGMAVSLGGILLAYGALTKLSSGTSQLAGAALAWRRIGSLYRASARPEQRGDPDSLRRAGADCPSSDAGAVLLQAHALSYRYRERESPALRDCSLEIRDGERLLLGGISGAGKSTLVSLLSGLRRPDHGILLLRGADRTSLGTSMWRRRIAAAPQFHENHVMTESLAFNVLLGRRWPPSAEELSEAEALCRELGLSELIDRMPSGMMQMVGEGGWQLSHGERSRVYLARALLQRSDLVVLDESFGALDAETLERALRCALGRAPALVVVAHP